MTTKTEHKFHTPKSSGVSASGMSRASLPGAPCGRCGGEICNHYDSANGWSCRLLAQHGEDHANAYGSWK